MTSIVAAINLVQAAFAEKGVAKGGKNSGLKYAFRTVDDMYSILNPALRRAEMVLIPQVLSREESQYKTKHGTIMRHVTLHVQYSFHTADTQMPFVSKTYGEAMDTSDKATNKAFTAAFKYMLIQVFAIPFEGIEDADQDSPEHVAESPPTQETAPPEANEEEVRTFNTLMGKGDGLELYAFLSGKRHLEPSFYDQAPKGKKTAMKEAVRSLCSNGAAMAGDYAIQIHQMIEGDDSAGASELVSELSKDAKMVVWRLMTDDDKEYLRTALA